MVKKYKMGDRVQVKEKNKLLFLRRSHTYAPRTHTCIIVDISNNI